jgi:hypothetical protein
MQKQTRIPTLQSAAALLTFRQEGTRQEGTDLFSRENRSVPVFTASKAAAALLGIAIAATAGAQQPPSPASLAASDWTVPRLADGKPDLQGIWTNKTVTPFERPADLADKEFFTREEAEAYVSRALQRSNRDNRTDDVNDVLSAYNAFWWDSGTSLLPGLRTSIVVDPPNGRIPALTPARTEALAAQRAAVEKRCEQPGCAVANSGAPAPADQPEALDLMTRCISFGTVVPMLPSAYNNNYQIVQTDGMVAINTEMVHQVRRIPTDGKPHLPPNVRQWFGDPRGHWEGDSLVVESTNFKGEFFGRMAAADENLRVVERFTRVAPDVLLYQFTVDDPTAWTAPWSGEIPLTRIDGLLYEYACHEGNRGMENILRAARKEIREAEAR